MAHACQRGPPTTKETNGVNKLDSVSWAKDLLHSHARRDEWGPAAGQTACRTDGESPKEPAEIPPQGDGTDAQKDALLHSPVLEWFQASHCLCAEDVFKSQLKVLK